jgi:hypothetical protein
MKYELGRMKDEKEQREQEEKQIPLPLRGIGMTGKRGSARATTCRDSSLRSE